MPLKIETFSNAKGGNAFFKAVSHPLAARKWAALIKRYAGRRIAYYDPLGFLDGLKELLDQGPLSAEALFVQDLSEIGRDTLGLTAEPVTALSDCRAEALFVTAFDAARLIDHIRHLIPQGMELFTLDEIRLPDPLLTDRRRYLSPLNFATNFVFFRDEKGHHTRLQSANYWAGYGAERPTLWCCLFGAQGQILAEWEDQLSAGISGFAIDSQEVRQRFGLTDFTGQLFVHFAGVAGHDVVKYALDTYGEAPEVLSCTHDANAWPSDRYAGLPAPKPGERVVLWVQNSHPAPIKAGEIGLNLMGRDEIVWLDETVPGFGTVALETGKLLPGAVWPQQIEVRAGKHFVRPRYEVFGPGAHSRIAHVNVERADLKPDPQIPELANLLGKGHLLPAPLLPRKRYRSIVLPTPMATRQANLPCALIAYDRAGKEVGRRPLGKLPRDHSIAVDAESLLDGHIAADDYGHLELVYDFSEGGEADGWLHALFRYEDKKSGHTAETSFGAHIFNAVLTYRDEPQSYAGRPPGLSTRLFLRLGNEGYETFCHLIYPASTPWHAESRTEIALHDASGASIAMRDVRIACGGSYFWRVSEVFDAADLEAAGETGYVLIRDTTCRLFGYHGLIKGETAFSLDHMFGF